MPPPPISFGVPPKAHNYGSQCRLAPVSYPFSPSDVHDIPPVNAQYFYTSPIPIDDPLSTSTIPATTDPKSARGNLQPFSPGDNNALEQAWLGLSSDAFRRNHDNARRNRSPSPSLAKTNAEKLDSIIREIAIKHAEKHAREGPTQDMIQTSDPNLPPPDLVTSSCCSELLADVGVALRASFCAVTRRKQPSLDRDRVAQSVIAEMKTLHTDSTASVMEKSERSHSISSKRWSGEPLPRASRIDKPANDRPLSSGAYSDIVDRSESRARSRSQLGAQVSSVEKSVNMPTKPSFVDDGITGTPFVRVGDPDATTFSPPSSLPRAATSLLTNKSTEEKKNGAVKFKYPTPEDNLSSLSQPVEKSSRLSVEVPVGVSRLHEVSLPALQMKPIYWSPVNDVAAVFRATWFYRDDMRPMDPVVANQLEAGYRELKPHTETWNDELRCAVEVGPLGEEKVSHPLWPKAPTSSTNKTDEFADSPISSNPFCAAHCFHGEAAAEGNLASSSNKDKDSSPEVQTHRKFEQYHVIYKDETTAYLLKPSLKPSAYYGRRPVAKIMKGLTIGIPVVRGFDYEAWMRRHQKKQTQQQNQPPGPVTNNCPESSNREVCPACDADEERRKVTDLVLVAHGIGQKLAERVENYHFTHAINAFRRAINIDYQSEAVKSVLREGQNGIMVLPVNWRQNLSFEEGGPMREEDKAHYTPQGFSLKDIEPKTIPAVRSMISDVMFDIPFYMSHHKPKIVAAMVGEANRVYRLWCRNNPGFSENGRVHLIGHSLGSVMAVEVLSKQPTTVPPLQLTRPLQLQHFDFDTKNLFLLGSPAAFFLLLERGALLPRRGRRKPGADLTDTVSRNVVGDAGLFGCLAVDNVYNVMAREDAVAYLLNGTIDPMYAASLKTAYVPSVSASFLQSMGDAMKSIIPGAASSSATNPAFVRPPTIRLPSQLELEVHDFSREEIAEKKAFLLNDNGQIDYFLRSGSGPLELQYLNMLSAHSSYWMNHDLIRMLCMEIGRRPGKAHTMPAMRAVKTAKRALPLTI
ncbi:DDHD domain-containing protein [Whalleya microplaca]|nr:DDHD domain-containing protein [Whalleya microplaca]